MKSFLITVALLVATLASATPRHRRDLSHLSRPQKYYRHQQRYVAPKLRVELSEKQSLQLPKVNYGPPFRSILEPIIDLEADPRLNEIVDSYGNPIDDPELISLWATRVPVPHIEYGVPKEYVRTEPRLNYYPALKVYKTSVPFYYEPDSVGF